MGITCDIAYRSLNKFTEVLCGDKVEVVKTDDSDIMILADGMGSGVRANILSTLTSKIIGTMLTNGATLDECVDTIVSTLPVGKVRKVAYSTFSILKIRKDGEAYLAEFDNPGCVFIRDGIVVPIPEHFRTIDGKKINEVRFRVKVGDVLVLSSDGTVHAGVGGGNGFSFGWGWDNLAGFTAEKSLVSGSAKRLTGAILDECNRIYHYRPGDDTTVGCIRIIDRKVVHLMTGPAKDKADDERMVRDFMSGGDDVRRVISGGTSANIVSRVLDRRLRVSLAYVDPEIPPLAYMDGMDLVTEGVITLNRVVHMLNRYVSDEDDPGKLFSELDREDAASRIAKLLIEDCTDIVIYAGLAVNTAYQSPDLPLDLSIRRTVVGQLEQAIRAVGKNVEVRYY